MTGDFQPLTVKEVVLSLRLPEAGIEPIERTAKLTADDRWEATLTVPRKGKWVARIDLLVTDFEKLSLEENIEIGGK